MKAKWNFLDLGCIIKIFMLLSKIALNSGKHIGGHCSIHNGVFSAMPKLNDGSCCTPKVVDGFRNRSVSKFPSIAIGHQEIERCKTLQVA